MDASGIGKIFAKELPSTTYEGDNYILNLQVARAALKTLKSVRASPQTPLSPSSAYLASLSAPFTPLVSAPQNWLSHQFLLHIISLRAALQVQRLERLVGAGKQFSELSWECVAVSKSIVEAFLVGRMLVAIDEPEGLLSGGIDGAERQVIVDLVHFVRPSLPPHRAPILIYDDSTSSTRSKRPSQNCSNSESSLPARTTPPLSPPSPHLSNHSERNSIDSLSRSFRPRSD